MSNGYYYLISSLPELSLTDKELLFDVVGFRDFIWDDLDTEDARLMKTLYYFYDVSNLASLVKNDGSNWNKAGNYAQEEWQTMLPENLPDFLAEFHQETADNWDQWNEKQWLNHAMSAYLDWAQETPNDFLRQWVHFSANLKNLLVYLNCNKFDLDTDEAVLGNQTEAEYLRETAFESADFSWWDVPAEEVQALFNHPNIAMRENLLDELLWKQLDELEGGYSFGVERLLAYAIRLRIINRNLGSEEEGRERLQELMHEITKDYSMPETFS